MRSKTSRGGVGALASLAVLLVGGCAALGARGGGVEPAIVEVEVTPWTGAAPDGTASPPDAALYFAARLNGPFTGKLDEVALERDGRTVASARPRNQWVTPARDQQQRIGAGQLDDSGALVLRDTPDLMLSKLKPGSYTLVLRFRGNYARPVTSKIPVELVRLPSTAGYQLAISPLSYISRAAIRFETESLYGERSRAPNDQFWMTIPVDVRQELSRVDVLWYHRGALRGSFTRELTPGPIAVGQPFKVPVRMWGWPENLSKEQVFAMGGDWSLHVIQDGKYLTTCRVSVAGGGFRGAGTFARSLPCAPDRSEATADARARGALLRGHGPDPLRSREVLALHRSWEVRDALLALSGPSRDQDQMFAMQAVAAHDRENAITGRQWKQADRRLRAAKSDRDAASADYHVLRRRYERLVEKYSR